MTAPCLLYSQESLSREGHAASPSQPGSHYDDVGSQSADSTVSTESIHQYPRLVPVRSTAPDPLRWGHLENLKRIGEGVFGTVFRAWDTSLEREVALKLCRRADDGSEDWSLLSLREARLLARIRHPNVVTVYGVDRHDGRQGVWMEYICGRTLATLLLQNGPLAAREAAVIGLDVCNAVAATHSFGLLHRDIKTKNVMREDGGRIVLLDFGLSQDLHDASLAGPASRIRGTPLYMAPELLRGERPSIQSDIFGIGVLLYHLVTGSYPANGRCLTEMSRIYERGDAKPLRDRRPGLPESFLWTIDRALSPQPSGRFATAGQMAQMLAASLLEDVSSVSSARYSAPKPASPLRSRCRSTPTGYSKRWDRRPPLPPSIGR